MQLGSPRHKGEGVRLGTVRHPPRGVPKSRHASDDWYDVWLPNLAPSAGLVAAARKWGERERYRKLAAKYRSEMSKPEPSRLLDALAALSHSADFSVGCYCDDEATCHRSVLRKLLEERGAVIVG